MGRLTFILGGARSGKSKHAVELAKKFDKVGFIATCQPFDDEMKKRISFHKKNRPHHFVTFEEYKDIGFTLKKIRKDFDVIIIDCLTLYISNLLLNNKEQKKIESDLKSILKIINSIECDVIIVANEVGLSIVPDNKLARDFRDLAGNINQLVARSANNIFFMIAGIPMNRVVQNE